MNANDLVNFEASPAQALDGFQQGAKSAVLVAGVVATVILGLLIMLLAMISHGIQQGSIGAAYAASVHNELLAPADRINFALLYDKAGYAVSQR